MGTAWVSVVELIVEGTVTSGFDPLTIDAWPKRAAAVEGLVDEWDLDALIPD